MDVGKLLGIAFKCFRVSDGLSARTTAKPLATYVRLSLYQLFRALETRTRQDASRCDWENDNISDDIRFMNVAALTNAGTMDLSYP
jgi:hypothetical protein